MREKRTQSKALDASLDTSHIQANGPTNARMPRILHCKSIRYGRRQSQDTLGAIATMQIHHEDRNEAQRVISAARTEARRLEQLFSCRACETVVQAPAPYHRMTQRPQCDEWAIKPLFSYRWSDPEDQPYISGSTSAVLPRRSVNHCWYQVQGCRRNERGADWIGYRAAAIWSWRV